MIDMGTYRKRPIEVQAIQFTGDNVAEIWEAFGADGIYGPTGKNPDHLILTTTHGDPAPARAGDWVVPDSKPGTFYPIKPDVFERTYEPVDGDTHAEPVDEWLIWSHEHRSWWAPNSCGYRSDIAAAGRYTRTDAEHLCSLRSWASWDRPPEVMVLPPPADLLGSSRLDRVMRARLEAATAEAVALRAARAEVQR